MTDLKLTGAQAMFIADLEDNIDITDVELEVTEHWGLIDDSIEHVDVEEGWQKEQFVITNTRDYPDKFFGFGLYYNLYEGWSIDNNNAIKLTDIIDLYEVIQVPAVKYIRKDEQEHIVPIAPDEIL